MTLCIEGKLSDFDWVDKMRFISVMVGVGAAALVVSFFLRPCFWCVGKDCEFYWGFECGGDGSPHYRFKVCA